MVSMSIGIMLVILNDNRCMAAEEQADGAGLGFTTFEKVSGGDFYPGMLVREIK